MFLDKFRFCPHCGGGQFKPNDGRSKRCLDCGFTYYMNASGAYVAFILNRQGQLLVVRRAKEPARGTLDLPGGFADPDETAEQGVAREVLEETGLKVTHAEYLFSVPNLYEYSGMQIPTLDLSFLCTVGDTSRLCASDDAAEAAWLSLEDIKASDFGLRSVSEAVERFVKLFKDKRANK